MGQGQSSTQKGHPQASTANTLTFRTGRHATVQIRATAGCGSQTRQDADVVAATAVMTSGEV